MVIFILNYSNEILILNILYILVSYNCINIQRISINIRNNTTVKLTGFTILFESSYFVLQCSIVISILNYSKEFLTLNILYTLYLYILISYNCINIINTRIKTPVKLIGFTILFESSYFVLWYSIVISILNYSDEFLALNILYIPFSYNCMNIQRIFINIRTNTIVKLTCFTILFENSYFILWYTIVISILNYSDEFLALNILYISISYNCMNIQRIFINTRTNIIVKLTAFTILFENSYFILWCTIVISILNYSNEFLIEYFVHFNLL